MNKKKNKKSSRTIKPLTWAQNEGCAFPLGATVVAEDSSVNFAIYSKHATSVSLLLFASDNFQHPCYRFEFDYLKNKSGPVWHCRLPPERQTAFPKSCQLQPCLRRAGMDANR